MQKAEGIILQTQEKGGTMENQIKQEQKPILIPRCVTTEEMLNIINDKLDFLLMKAQEKK